MTEGVKYDTNKVRPALCVVQLAHAITAVSQVLTYGANKYSEENWALVPNGTRRYTDAMLRHLLREATGEYLDPESKLPHAAHLAANALIRLELLLREEMQPQP